MILESENYRVPGISEDAVCMILCSATLPELLNSVRQTDTVTTAYTASHGKRDGFK